MTGKLDHVLGFELRDILQTAAFGGLHLLVVSDGDYELYHKCLLLAELGWMRGKLRDDGLFEFRLTHCARVALELAGLGT